MAALVLLIVIAVGIALAPTLAPYAYDAQDMNLIGLPDPPSAAHLFGTDPLGRDGFSRVLWGGRVSLVVGLASALVATAVGTAVGALAGFFGRPIDTALMRVTDVALSMPALPLVLLISGLVRPNVPILVLLIGSLAWMTTARLVRAQFLTLRERDFVEAARALGVGSARLIWRHILPNAIAPVTVSATLAVGQAILLESAMSFFGFGVQPPTPTWGNLLNEATPYLDTAPWLAVPPGLLIFLTVLA
ncbi:MAG TPA: ABC transporter permease, partial [Acetobacteraceae bacterium]|nr:ABC transporter permease [Acetobacteraceae bacterium]